MLTQQPDIEMRSAGSCAGPCADCGTFVERRIECVDHITHSTVELCASCWVACQQRQIFTQGCCG